MPQKKCQHNHQPYYCKECKQLGIGGKGLCLQNKRKILFYD
jgi:hypothetical protein